MKATSQQGFLSVFVLLTVCSVYIQSFVILPERTINENNVARALFHIATDVCKEQHFTIRIIQCEPISRNLITPIMDQIHSLAPFTIEQVEDVHKYNLEPQLTIILIKEGQQFLSFEARLNATYFHPRGFFIVVVEEVLNLKERKYLSKKIFNSFLGLFYDNVNVIFRIGSKVRMYTFSACTATNPSYEAEPILQNTFEGGQFMKDVPHFPEKWTNMHGCPVTVAIAHTPPYIVVRKSPEGGTTIDGFDHKILENVASSFNFTLNYHISDNEGTIFINGTSTDTLKAVISGESNMTVGGCSTSTLRANFFSSSITYHETDLVYVLSIHDNYRELKKHLLPLSKEIWFVFAAIYICTFILLSIVKKYGFKLYRFIMKDQYHSTLLQMFEVFVQVSTPRIPNRAFTKILFSVWLMSSFIITTVYRGRLVDVLTSGSPYIPRSISELDKTDYEFYVKPPLDMYAKTFLNKRHIIIPVEILNFFEELQIYKGKRRAVLVVRDIVNYFYALHYHNGILPVVPERLQVVVMNFLFKKNSYLVKPFDDALFSFINSGLLDKWMKMTVKNDLVKAFYRSHTPVQLKISHMSATLWLYLLLIGVCLGIFAIELISLKFNWLRNVILYCID